MCGGAHKCTVLRLVSRALRLQKKVDSQQIVRECYFGSLSLSAILGASAVSAQPQLFGSLSCFGSASVLFWEPQLFAQPQWRMTADVWCGKTLDGHIHEFRWESTTGMGACTRNPNGTTGWVRVLRSSGAQ